nr:COBRA-like protein 7 [Lolium perenne]
MATERFVLLVFLCYLSSQFADAYDPVDPLGNITINWDFTSMDTNQYTVMVSIHNYQLYRHIERPGWRLGWAWSGHEIIWDVRGAETTELGNCSGVHFDPGHPPHCCEKRPVVVDLPPGAPYNIQVANCCRGGVLSSLTQNNSTATAAFQMSVGGFDRDGGDPNGDPVKPANFSLGVPGYTCSNATQVPATRSKVDEQRHVQVMLTWQITCSYSQFRDGPSPSCCVSLSSFYNSTIVGCPQCSCGCPRSPSAPQCFRFSGPRCMIFTEFQLKFAVFGQLSVRFFFSDGEQSKLQPLPDADGNPPTPVIRCTEHMCPIRVHWHVKQNYREYWRVKASITNYDMVSNYSDWNLVVRHPNLANITQLFSFNYQPLIQYDTINDTAMFWGIVNYNEMLLRDGNVQTEMILKKDPSDFTFSGGWAFPRRVYFNGHQCAMPSPDQYPSLPNAASDVRVSAVQRWLITGSCLLLLSMFHVV